MTIQSKSTSTREREALPWDVGSSDQIPERGRLVVDLKYTTIGIFRMNGQLYAYENICAHQGGPVCQGKILARVREVIDNDRASRGFAFDESDMHIVCPWHGYEFSITTGRHAGVPEIQLTQLPVEERDGRIYVTV